MSAGDGPEEEKELAGEMGELVGELFFEKHS